MTSLAPVAASSSSTTRGLTAAELHGKPAELSPPTVLLKRALEHDKMFTY